MEADAAKLNLMESKSFNLKWITTKIVRTKEPPCKKKSGDQYSQVKKAASH